jgi:hypothetical protein
MLTISDIVRLVCFEVFLLPTQKQSDTAIFLCQLLSNLYQPIQVFRYDLKLRTIYIQAGRTDEIAAIIDADGNWRFVL